MAAFARHDVVLPATPVEDRLRRVIDTIPALVLSARPDGSVDFINQQWLEYTGFKAEDLQGWGWRNVIHLDDVERFVKEWRGALAAGEPFENEARVRRADGEYRWFRIRKVPLRDKQGKIVEWYGTGHDIEDSKQAEARLRRSEAELQQVLDAIPAHVFAFEPDGRGYFANRQGLDYTGLNLQGVPLQDAYSKILHSEDIERTDSLRQRVLSEGLPFEIEARMRAKTGEYRWFLVRVNPLKDEHGRVIRWYGTRTDIEDLKRTEGELRRDEFYLAEGQRLAHSGSWAFNPSGYFYHWSRELFRIYGLDPDGKAPTLDEYLSLIHPDDRESMAQTIERTLAEHIGCDITKRIVWPSGEVRYIRCVGVPVVEQGALKEIVGTAIDVTDQEYLTQELQRREAYLAEAQKLSHTGSFGWDVTSGDITWSDETFRIFQLDRATEPSLPLILQRIHPEDRTSVQETLDRATRDGTAFDLEHRLLMPDGSIKHVHVVARVVDGESHKTEFIGAITDITDRKRGDHALRESETRFRTFMEHAAGAVFVHDEQGIIVDANRHACDSLGLSRDELIGTTAMQFDTDVNWQFLEEIGQRLAAGEVVAFASHHRRKDGTVFPVEIRSRSFLQGGRRLTLDLALDMTDRKRAEEAIRQSEKQLRDVIETMPSIAWTTLPDGSNEFVNRRWQEYTGLSAAEAAESGWKAAVHPKDIDHHREKWRASLAGGEAFENEVRFRRGEDGAYRWFLVRAVPLRDRLGNILKWYGTATDIDERKRAEERVRNENVVLREEIDRSSMFEEIIGSSAPLRRVLVHVAKVAPTDSTVLITGETGTGKELVARAIHKRSNRSAHAFVSVNCAAIPTSLTASELFGYEKGAFTGATQRRLGRFELADGGTIFLDEVGELPPETQVALLRVLQERTLERVGGSQSISADVRVLAATNRDLQAAVEAGTFRQDLFYRLNVFPIHMPPLRDRVEDIPLLVEYLTERYASKAGKKIASINKQTLDLFKTYDWPGNIRELQNVLERAVILCDGDILAVDETWLQRELPRPIVATRGLGRADPDQERELIESALTESRGRVSGPGGAAAKLGIPRSTLESRIRSLQINKYQFKSG